MKLLRSLLVIALLHSSLHGIEGEEPQPRKPILEEKVNLSAPRTRVSVMTATTMLGTLGGVII